MFGAIAGGIASALAGGAMSKLFGGGQKAASGGIQGDVLATRSEERRVGKECRSRRAAYHHKKNQKDNEGAANNRAQTSAAHPAVAHAYNRGDTHRAIPHARQRATRNT